MPFYLHTTKSCHVATCGMRTAWSAQPRTLESGQRRGQAADQHDVCVGKRAERRMDDRRTTVVT